jgi:hypothetical protein
LSESRGRAGQGAATAKGEVTGLDIDPTILVASEKEVVEDLILAAIHDAQARARADRTRNVQAGRRHGCAPRHEASVLRMADETGIEALIELMARLPGLGPRSARRAVLVLLKKRAQLMAPLAQSLAE